MSAIYFSVIKKDLGFLNVCPKFVCKTNESDVSSTA